jgi:hypothetical protein
MTIWRIACWISKATNNTNPEYVIIIPLPRRQWLRERATMLRLYVHYRFFFVIKTLLIIVRGLYNAVVIVRCFGLKLISVPTSHTRIRRVFWKIKDFGLWRIRQNQSSGRCYAACPGICIDLVTKINDDIDSLTGSFDEFGQAVWQTLLKTPGYPVSWLIDRFLRWNLFLCVVTPWSWADGHQRFGWAYCVLLQSRRGSEGGV